MKNNIRLTQQEADMLISMVKRAMTDYILLPERGETYTFDVAGERKQDVFTVNVFTSKHAADKFDFGARIKVNGTMLLELHVNPTTKHKNPDGQVIEGSHWHLYREGYGTSFAFPADDISSDDFVADTVLFLKKFNVIEIPDIGHQLHL